MPTQDPYLTIECDWVVPEKELTYFGDPETLGGLNLREVGMAFLSDGEKGSFPASPTERKAIGAIPTSWHQIQTFVIEAVYEKVLHSGEEVDTQSIWDVAILHWRSVAPGTEFEANLHSNLPLYSELSEFTKGRLDLFVGFLLGWVKPQLSGVKLTWGKSRPQLLFGYPLVSVSTEE